MEAEPSVIDDNRRSASTNYLIIDVREESELANGYNLGDEHRGREWVNIPLSRINATRDADDLADLLQEQGIDRELDDYRDLMFLCKVGIRSGIAAQHVLKLNVAPQLYNIVTGILGYFNEQ